MRVNTEGSLQLVLGVCNLIANLGLVCIIFHNDRLGNLDIILVSFIMKMIGVGYFKLFFIMV
jgi:hypothetical protein